MEKARHVLRVFFLLFLLIAGMVLGRSFLIPDSYGKHGPYRFASVAEQRDRPVVHHGSESCKQCHEKEWTMREDGEGHLKVGCEVCHAPLLTHATGPVKDKDKKTADMHRDKTWKLCARCHLKLEGRPKEFPQVVFDAKHMKGDRLEGDICKKCHDPHSTMFEEEPSGGKATAGSSEGEAKPATPEK